VLDFTGDYAILLASDRTFQVAAGRRPALRSPNRRRGGGLLIEEIFGGGFGSATNAELLEDVPQMIADGSGGDKYLSPDLFV